MVELHTVPVVQICNLISLSASINFVPTPKYYVLILMQHNDPIKYRDIRLKRYVSNNTSVKAVRHPYPFNIVTQCQLQEGGVKPSAAEGFTPSASRGNNEFQMVGVLVDSGCVTCIKYLYSYSLRGYPLNCRWTMFVTCLANMDTWQRSFLISPYQGGPGS